MARNFPLKTGGSNNREYVLTRGEVRKKHAYAYEGGSNFSNCGAFLLNE